MDKNTQKISNSITFKIFLGDEKKRTLSKKRKKKKSKTGDSMSSSYDATESFTKAREPKRIESVDVEDDNTDYEKSLSSISTKNIELDKVRVYKR